MSMILRLLSELNFHVWKQLKWWMWPHCWKRKSF